ncbi:toxin-antitoxin system HicB family antitoxin [Heyndrickxia camelliae]|nr:toxin-antitoxin system HicB family antitoxin [Heyndrickxia camelliae]
MSEFMRFSLRIPSDLHNELKQLADEDMRSLNTYIVKALEKHVAEEQGKMYIDIKVADQENNRGLQRDTQRQMNLRKPIRDEQRVAENTSKYNKE